MGLVLDLGPGRAGLGVGCVPLWTLGIRSRPGLDLDSAERMGVPAGSTGAVPPRLRQVALGACGCSVRGAVVPGCCGSRAASAGVPQAAPSRLGVAAWLWRTRSATAAG